MMREVADLWKTLADDGDARAANPLRPLVSTRRVVPADVGGSKAATVRQYHRRNAGVPEAIQLRRIGF